MKMYIKIGTKQKIVYMLDLMYIKFNEKNKYFFF